MRPTRPGARCAILLAAILALAGCASDQRPDRGAENTATRANDEPGAAADSPDLPPGTSIKGGAEVQKNRTTEVHEWKSTVKPASFVGASPTATTKLELPGSASLEVRFDFTHGSAVSDPPGTRVSLAFTARDDHGQSRCLIGKGQSCEVALKRPSPEVRVWGLEVSSLATAELEAPFKVTVTVRAVGNSTAA